jgi:hypothetical protein
MKSFATLLIAVILLATAGGCSVPAATPTLAGAWAVDLARLPVPPEARPRSVTITFAAADEGQWATTVEVVDAGGNSMRAQSVTPLDGTATAVTGNLEADVAATRMPVPGVLVMSLALGGMPGSTRIYTVSADGRSMIETAANFGDDGRPVMRTNYFTRVR